MKIHIRFAGTMRNWSERKEMEMEVPPGTSPNDLLRILQGVLPATFSQLVIEPILTQKPDSLSILMINQKHIADRNGFDQSLNSQDEIVFLSPMEGG